MSFRWKQGTPDPVGASRRELLKRLAVGGVATTLAAGAAEGMEQRRQRRLGVLVFRLTTRNHSSCNACAEHHKYKIATSHALLNANRAHPGCNCPIVRQEISRQEFRRLFPTGSGIVDVRRGRRRRA